VLLLVRDKGEPLRVYRRLHHDRRIGEQDQLIHHSHCGVQRAGLTVVASVTLQSILMGAYIELREPGQLVKVIANWQVELLFTVATSVWILGEKMARREMVGIALVIMGILLLV